MISEEAFPTVSPETLLRYQKRRLEDIAKLSQALKSRDFKTVRDIGHRVKGNAALYGLHHLGMIARDLEEAAEAGDVGRASSCLARFESEVSRIH